MSLILNIETSTKNCSVNLAKNGISIVSIEEEHEKKFFHSEKLHVFIKYVLEISGINIKNIQSICVSEGPGSYSSLRIGSSTAKGLCLSLNIPLLSLNSFMIMIQKINIKQGLLIPMIHAKSNYFYTSLFDQYKNQLNSIFLKKIDNDFFDKKIENQKKYLIGNFNVHFLKKYFSLKKYNFIQSSPSAFNMSYLSYVKFCKKKFQNIEQYAPIYK